MPEYISGIFLDFDNIFSSLYAEDPHVAADFASDPRLWLGALSGMRGTETEETRHRFVVRRCYMNPAGRIEGGEPFSRYRQNFVREGWEVIDTPPLTSQGKTSADIHIVMDVLDTVTSCPHVTEYIIMAADADYTPLVIRLRRYMKTTIVYSSKNTAAAYKAACDSEISQASILELYREDRTATHEEAEPKPPALPAPSFIAAAVTATPERVKEAVSRFFSESEPGFHAQVSSIGRMLTDEFGSSFDPELLGYKSISQLLRRLCGLRVEMIENRTVASMEPAEQNPPQ
jgi:hypothetical protein